LKSGVWYLSRTGDFLCKNPKDLNGFKTKTRGSWTLLITFLEAGIRVLYVYGEKGWAGSLSTSCTPQDEIPYENTRFQAIILKK
jgi:hypothetical protein